MAHWAHLLRKGRRPRTRHAQPRQRHLACGERCQVSSQSQGHGLGQWHVSRLAAPKSAHPGAKAALAEIYNAEDKDHALKAAKAFEADYGAQWTKATAKITEHLDVLLAFYDYPAEHWIHLRTTNPIESTLATVRLRQRITKGPGSRRLAWPWRSSSSGQHRPAGVR